MLLWCLFVCLFVGVSSPVSRQGLHQGYVVMMVMMMMIMMMMITRDVPLLMTAGLSCFKYLKSTWHTYMKEKFTLLFLNMAQRLEQCCIQASDWRQSPTNAENVRLGHSPIKSETVQLGHSPIKTKTVQLGHSPVKTKTVQLGHSPVKTETVQLGHSPIKTKAVQLGHSPIKTETVQLCQHPGQKSHYLLISIPSELGIRHFSAEKKTLWAVHCVQQSSRHDFPFGNFWQRPEIHHWLAMEITLQTCRNLRSASGKKQQQKTVTARHIISFPYSLL